jgi:hypothetical protein
MKCLTERFEFLSWMKGMRNYNLSGKLTNSTVAAELVDQSGIYD